MPTPIPRQTTYDTDDPYNLLDQIRSFSIVSIGIVVYDGQNYTTHQVGMSDYDLAIASDLWKRFAEGDYGHSQEQ